MLPDEASTTRKSFLVLFFKKERFLTDAGAATAPD
jgi:hypothetical protein